MGKLTKHNKQYLSAPALNKINSELYLEGKTFSTQSNPDADEKARSKSLISGSSTSQGSSTNEKSGSAPWKLLDVEIEQRTSYSSYLQVHNVRSGSTRSVDRSSRNGSRISCNGTQMTQAYSVSRGPADPDGSAGAPLQSKNFENTDLIQTSRSSKARQKKFHRHFKQVDVAEKVLDYYSCALVGDILLQGHLYITENYFAFYSNVFGYVTKLLIPTVDVLKISKEKTAKIIPNAVGISTEDEKHVFGSLLSRDSTYKFMVQVWKAANSSPAVNINAPPIIKTEMPSDEDSSISTGNEEPSSYISNLTTGPSSENFQKLLPTIKRKSILMTSMESPNSKRETNSKIFFPVCVTLIIFLFASAGFYIYKIAIIQNRFNSLALSSRGSETYEEILKWQSTSHTSSANKFYEFIDAQLNQITKARLSLEALSMLLLPRSNQSENTNSKKWGSTKVKKDTNDGANVKETTTS